MIHVKAALAKAEEHVIRRSPEITAAFVTAVTVVKDVN